MLRRMAAFWRLLKRHDFAYVRNACIIDAQFLASITPTAFNSNLVRLILRFEPRFSLLNDDVLTACDRISAWASDSDLLSFFREIGSLEALDSFCVFLQRLPPAQLRLLILFTSSLLRFRFCCRPSELCPLCGRKWLWQHFFTCRFLSAIPIDSTRALQTVKPLIRDGLWDEFVLYVHFYLLQWRDMVSNPILTVEDIDGLTSDRTDNLWYVATCAPYVASHLGSCVLCMASPHRPTFPLLRLALNHPLRERVCIHFTSTQMPKIEDFDYRCMGTMDHWIHEI